MANIKNTNWHEKWKEFYWKALKEDLEKETQTINESKSTNKEIDKEFQRFEKIWKKNIQDFKKRITNRYHLDDNED